MRLPAELPAAAAPVAALLPWPWPSVPWYVHLVVGLSGPLTYAFHRYLLYRLATKALDRIDGGAVAEVVAIVATSQPWTGPEDGIPRPTGTRHCTG